MPRGLDGSYSLPNGSLVTVGETITPSQHNPPLQDIAQAMTDSLSRDGRGGMRQNLPMGGFRVTGMAPGVQPSDGATVSQLTGISGVPVGFIGDWPSATAPTGWLICAGQTLSRTDFPDLFAVVGTAFGAPSGSTFNLPDYRGRVSAGLDVNSGGFADRLTVPNSRVIGSNAGSQVVALTEAQMPTHTHVVSGSTDVGGSHNHEFSSVTGTIVNAGSGGTFARGSGSVLSNTEIGGTHSHAISVSAANAGGNDGHPNVQPTLVMCKIIKVSSS